MLNNTDNTQKICLIEDIFKTGKLLAGYIQEFNIWLTPTGFMFDTLYDKSIKELETIQLNMQIELNSVIYKRVLLRI
jgi:hypothetical protein